jgi:hypothetical protein
LRQLSPSATKRIIKMTYVYSFEDTQTQVELTSRDIELIAETHFDSQEDIGELSEDELEYIKEFTS